MPNLEPIVAVIDDDESVCRSIQRLLRSAGIEAETFSSGAQFLDTLTSTPSYRPACVILDIQMPGINGLEVQRRILPMSLPIIVITAYDEMSARQAAMAAGAMEYLCKPLNGAILIGAVERALGRQSLD
ncbi:response regulator transcription factor [Paraburkholderia metrosideri]|jgi:FixJ family two-component response regulator|uniref:Response regulator protein TmoT n=1 Tax=Paraburkholderia metrosideri TaxID=580937 RepID=A0ABM8NC42_9BURK|nr:response regulator [Paraburkholderia metrosideri]CAD6516768.1 Response regulator protein TmoT [Paraburkholderia metrosideri]